MKIEITNLIKLPKSEMKNLNYKAYIYETKSGDLVKNFWIDDNYIYLPRNLEKFYKNYRNKEIQIFSKFPEKPMKSPFRANLQLRDYQVPVIEKFKELINKGYTDILLQAETGYGKGVTLQKIIEIIQQKTLIIVDMTMLVDQFVKEFNKFSNKKLNVINKDNLKIDDVNIVTVQFLNRNKDYLEKIKDEFNLVVQDECHVTAAETIKETFQKFNTKYRYGMSATPTRSDGLTELLYDVFPYKIVGKGTSIPLEVHFLEDYYGYINGANYKKSVKNFINNVYLKRLDLIVNKLVGKLNKSIMIAINDNELQELFEQRYKKYGTAILNGNTTKKVREQILNDYENEKVKILIGYKVLMKGISIPRMEVLINLFAGTTKENLTQLIGRLTRQHDKKKKGIFIDFNLMNCLNRQRNVKIQTYNKLKDKMNIKIIRIELDKYLRKLNKI
jgi:superfamily II DNA or RNA helicase